MKNPSELFFKYRSYTPIPFFILMLFFEQASLSSMIIGFLVVLIGEFFRFWGVSYAGSETRTTGGGVGGTYLVISGAFGHVRNPLYVGNMLIYTGIGIMSYAWFPYLVLIALIFFYIQYYFIIREEEKFLLEKFGEDYKKYKESVPRWIPSFKKYSAPGIPQPEFNLNAAFKSERRTLQALLFIMVILIILFLV